MLENPIVRLLYYLPSARGKILFATTCSVLNKLCDIVPEILIGIAIDIVVNQQDSIVAQWGIPNPFYQLYVIGGLTALLWILESVFEYLYTITWCFLAQNIQHDLRLKTYDTLQNADLAYFENTTVGGLLNIIQDDIGELEQFLSRGPNALIQLSVNVFVMGLIFLYLSPVLACVTLIPIPCIIGIAYYFQRRLAHLYGIVRISAANLAGHIAYRLQGITTIKSYTTQQYELDLLQKESSAYQMANYHANVIGALYIPSVRMAVMVGFITSLIVGGVYALQGQIPINWYAALVFLTQRFLWPFTDVANITDMYEKACAAARRVLGILETIPTIVDGTEKFVTRPGTGTIIFDKISFGYSTGAQIFNRLSLQIPAGKTVAFVGATGSGKSTIIKLLLRFYDPTSGVISIDNQNIKSIKLDDLRSTIGLVSQEVYIVDGSINDNIAYGTPTASPDDIIKAAHMAQAHEFIIKLAHGYDTKVQEGGKNLSGGQRQRLAIARAILKKSSILIFDEATSAIDNETEAAIQKSMLQLAANHTIIIIAHRLSTVRNANIIYVLEKGVIVESGNHEELMRKNGAYARLASSAS